MILLTAVAVGLLITFLRAKLTGSRLQPIKLRFIWLVYVAVIPQIFLFQLPAVGRHVPDRLVSIILVGSQLLLLGFAVVNIKQPGITILGVGLFSNTIATIANGGWMPITPEIVHRILPTLPEDFPLVGRRMGLSKDWIFSPDEIKLPWLADHFTLPTWSPYQVAFSVGDILIAVGAIILLWSLSSPKHRRQNELASSG